MKELIHFTAEWCQPCKAMLPVITQFRDKHRDIQYTKIDIDQNPDAAKFFGVMGVPTFISQIEGLNYGRKTGKATLFQLESMFN
jgi:thioredoxin 1